MTLLELLRYHGNHCLQRGGEQSNTMLEAAAEIEKLRAALVVFISTWQTGTRPPESIENEAVELCGGMATIRDHEQRAALDQGLPTADDVRGILSPSPGQPRA